MEVRELQTDPDFDSHCIPITIPKTVKFFFSKNPKPPKVHLKPCKP